MILNQLTRVSVVLDMRRIRLSVKVIEYERGKFHFLHVQHVDIDRRLVFSLATAVLAAPLRWT
jgi:hypothetical protein